MRPRRPKHSQTRKKAKAQGFRSGFEMAVASQLSLAKVPYQYEPKASRIPYLPKEKKYLPDFQLENGVILEVKGRFTASDRVKHELIKTQHPELDIRFVFQRDNPINTGSKTRYSDWCDKRGFQYCFVTIPEEWYD
jgi:hypothetical protein